jgi:hypothetical protein
MRINNKPDIVSIGNRWILLGAFNILFFNLSCSQNIANDTPYAFAQRMQKALSSSTRTMLDNEIILSKDEHRALSAVWHVIFGQLQRTKHGTTPGGW